MCGWNCLDGFLLFDRGLAAIILKVNLIIEVQCICQNNREAGILWKNTEEMLGNSWRNQEELTRGVISQANKHVGML